MLRVLGLRAVAYRRSLGSAGVDDDDRHAIELTVNGGLRTIEVEAHHTLLEVLRDDLGLTGTKECCLVGECGACTVLVDGVSVDSCLVLAVEADGRERHDRRGARRPAAGSIRSSRRSSTRVPRSAASASRASWSRRRRCSR